MSERLLGPDLNSRLAYVPSGGALSSAVGMSAVVYANSVGDTLADIQIYDGTSTPAGPVPNSTLTVDSDSLIPVFWFPQNVDVVYVEVNEGTRTAINADYDMRLDDVSGEVNAPMLSTGLFRGGAMSVNPLNSAAVDIAPYQAYITDYGTDPTNPTTTKIVTTTTDTVALDTAAQARTVTFWLLDSDGNYVQQATLPTNSQRRQFVQLGASTFSAVTGTASAAQSTPVILPQLANQFYDLMYSLGAFSITGNALSASGSDLTLAKTMGTIFSVSFNHVNDPLNPHVFTLPAQSPVSFRHYTRVISSTGALTTTLDVGRYDNNGVITSVGGGTNSSTNFRVFATGHPITANQINIQYGQNVYSSLSAAQAGLRSGNYIVNPLFGRAVALLGYISVIRTATNLSDTAQAVFTKASKFDIP